MNLVLSLVFLVTCSYINIYMLSIYILLFDDQSGYAKYICIIFQHFYHVVSLLFCVSKQKMRIVRKYGLPKHQHGEQLIQEHTFFVYIFYFGVGNEYQNHTYIHMVLTCKRSKQLIFDPLIFLQFLYHHQSHATLLDRTSSASSKALLVHLYFLLWSWR